MKTFGQLPVIGTALAALVLPLPVAATATPPTASAPTCRGHQATLVGTPDQRLDGTDGDDVIVSNEATVVRAGAGDDLVCVTGDSGGPAVYDGPGNDIVDAHRFTGWQVEMALGAGSDRYVGSPERDSLVVEGRPGDRDRIRTGDHRDYVFVLGDARWYIAADLGPGNDRIDVGKDVVFDLAGGPGRDRIHLQGCDCDRVAADLGHGTWIDERQDADIPGFENAAIVAPIVELSGSRTRNRLIVLGCGAVVYGRRGNDDLANSLDHPCPGPTRIHGGEGDDVLRGSYYQDHLYGGAGLDVALGGAGRDLCRAEQQESCEE